MILFFVNRPKVKICFLKKKLFSYCCVWSVCIQQDVNLVNGQLSFFAHTCSALACLVSSIYTSVWLHPGIPICSVNHRSFLGEEVLTMMKHRFSEALRRYLIQSAGRSLHMLSSKRDFSRREIVLPQWKDTIKKYYIPLVNLFWKVKYFKALCLMHQHKTLP